jgi:predicted AAA+ superfamily ATPase
MLAHYHGQIWKSSEFARSFGVADTTVRRYLDILADTFMVRLLPAWHANLGKRQVKSPKVYFRDTGILHYLLGIRDQKGLENHPRVGASWEGFALEQVVEHLGAFPEECTFWATHTGAELDLLVARGEQRMGFEVKFNRAPTMTPSMRSSLKDLRLDKLTVIHAGVDIYPMGDRVEAVPLRRVCEHLRPIRSSVSRS